jgi:hypothetical protein
VQADAQWVDGESEICPRLVPYKCRTEKRDERFEIRETREVLRQLERVAQQKGTSKASLVRGAIRQWLAKEGRTA